MTPRKGPDDAITRQRRNLETLGLLSGHIVHDFNNLLMLMDGYARMILEEPGLSATARESAEEILRAVERGSQLTRQVLDFGRKPSTSREPLDLKRQIEKLRPILERLLGDSIHLEMQLPEYSLWVMAERDQMEQVLLNLIVNARDAMPLGGRIQVGALRDENAVVLRVIDTGEGIAAEALPRVFEPFYTTKESGKGTGIGLAMVREAVESWGGSVAVTSTAGEGAEFEIRLPAADNELRPEMNPSSQSQQGSILLAEDESGIRNLLRRVLEHEGFSVIEASTEADAIAASQLHNDLKILITDLELAQGDGRRLAKLVKLKHPGAKVIYISGYMQEVKDGEAWYLQKPFSPNTLVLAVRKLLATNRDS
jgi:CheY-like chemotaxis protein